MSVLVEKKKKKKKCEREKGRERRNGKARDILIYAEKNKVLDSF